MSLFQKGTPLALKRTKFKLGDDCHINLRELSSRELIEFQKAMGDKDTTNLEFVYKLIASCAVADDGKPIFDSPDDVRDNFDVGLSKLIEIQKQILSLSGLDERKN
jgi:hypothetical protein